MRGIRPVLAVLTVLVTVGSAALWVQAQRGGPAAYGYRSESYRAPDGVLVGTPATEPEGNAIYRVLIDNIRHTPPGATIRIIAHSCSLVPVAEALIAADRRGVRVQLVADRRITARYQATRMLVSALGRDRRAHSSVHLVEGEGRLAGGRQHQKTWMFSRTGDSRRVVMVGSMNLTYYSTRQYNDMVSYVDQRGPWRTFTRIHAELSEGNPPGPPIRVAEMRTDRGTDTAYVFPGLSPDDDPIQRILADIPPGPETRIRILQQGWLDTRGRAIAEQVARLARSGADVEVVHGKFFGDRIARILQDAEVPVHDGVFGTDGDDVHSKLMVAQYRDAGGRLRRIATTGSDNWSDRSFGNGEVVVRVNLDRGPGFARYLRFFDEIEDRARR